MYGFLKTFLVTVVFGIGLTTSSVATTVKISKEVQGFLFTKLDDIPSGPSPDVSGSLCESFIKQDPKFEEAKDIEEKGWSILDEKSFGFYKFVTFAGRFVNSQGFCEIQEGNLALFETDDLIGVLYAASKEYSLFGTLQIIEGGKIRLWNGMKPVPSPVADIEVGLNLIEVNPLSTIDSFCEGHELVPNLHISDDASKHDSLLDKFGWHHHTHEGCSSGLGFCTDVYTNGRSFLEVVSMSAGREVSDYQVHCDQKEWE